MRPAALAALVFALTALVSVRAKRNSTSGDLSVKEHLSTKIYELSDSFYCYGPGLGSSQVPVFEHLDVGTDVDIEPDNLHNRVKVKLLPGKSWGQPRSIIRVVKTVDQNGADVWVAPSPVQVAFVLATPAIESSEDPLGPTAKKLFISGSGFEPKHTYLTFAPTDLMAGDDYDLKIAADSLELTLRKNQGKRWGDAGPLKIVSVDTGGGPTEMDVQVATILADDHPSEIPATVESSVQPIYTSRTRTLTIKGTKFSEDQYIGFQGGCAVMGDDFTVTRKSEQELLLELKKGKEWCSGDVIDETPSGRFVLKVLSVRNHENLGKGVQVATVLLDPEIEKNTQQHLVDAALTIEIDGDGFVPGSTSLEFDPPLVKDTDYKQLVEGSTEVDITRLDGAVWTKTRSFPQPLKVVSIDTGAGKVDINDGAGIVVATLIKGGDVVQKITPSTQKVYQSAGAHWLVVEGSGLTSSPSKVTLGPDDCNAKASSSKLLGKGKINITIADKAEWCSFAGPLYLRSITVGGKKISLVGKKGGSTESQGVQIAYVLNDPAIDEDAKSVVYETHTKTIVIDVDGVYHTDEVDVQVKLDPPNEGVFTHESTNSDQLVLHLVDGKKWSGKADDGGKLYVKQINTGAGWVNVNSVVAIIESDSADTLCSDTCDWANDGTCDDILNDDYLTDDYMYETGWGTDCKDCGPRQPKTSAPTGSPTAFSFSRCEDSCDFANDGECDEPRPQSASKACALGTDCSDCGEIPSNEQNSNVDVLDARMCTDGLYGEAEVGERCVFPFTFEGKEFNECSHSNKVPQAAVMGWCPTTSDLATDDVWGSCAFCYDVNAEIEYYYDPYAKYYYYYQYAYESVTDEEGKLVTTKTKVQTKVAKTSVVDPHAGQRPSGASIGGSVVGIIGLALVAGAAGYAYKKFIQATPSTHGGGYSTVSNRDVELAGMPMRNSVPITPDNFTT